MSGKSGSLSGIQRVTVAMSTLGNKKLFILSTALKV